MPGKEHQTLEGTDSRCTVFVPQQTCTERVPVLEEVEI